jgi:hypothetical protein
MTLAGTPRALVIDTMPMCARNPSWQAGVNDWPDLVPPADSPREERALSWDHWLEVSHSRVTGNPEIICGCPRRRF